MHPDDFPNPIHTIRYGSNACLPEQRHLRAGPLTVILENGALKYVKIGETELVRQIYAAVRDESWGTIAPRFASYSVDEREDSFAVAFEAEHTDGNVDFVWSGRIEGGSDGTIRFAMDGTARRAFRKNRIGFCVLHPMDMAGMPVEVETPDGVVAGRFPERIAPHQPFHRIVALRQTLPQGVELELRFEGDLFEMEDQRNWTDASFKTYCTPLELPYPVQMRPGDRVSQSVTFIAKTASGQWGTAVAAGPTAKKRPHAGRETATVNGSAEVRVKEAAGVLPDLGLVHSGGMSPMNEWEREHLKGLRLSHLRAEVHTAEPDWRERLSHAIEAAGSIGAKLELEVVTGEHGEGINELVELLKRLRCSPARLLLYADLLTTEMILAEAQDAMRQAGWIVPIGGGTRAYFAEFNRARLPLGRMEAAGYPMNPQVHASDNESMVESLAAQAATVHSARAIVGDTPLAVGPVALKARFNPHAARSERKPGAIAARIDPRQMSLFCAGWTVGSLHQVSAAGVSAITYHETLGRCGLMSRNIGLFPVYHVFAEIGEMKREADLASGRGERAPLDILSVDVDDPLKVEAFALRHGDRLKLLVANLRNVKRRVRLETPPVAEAHIRMLDERSAIAAMHDREQFRQSAGPPIPGTVTHLDIELLPYAVCIVDAICG